MRLFKCLFTLGLALFLITAPTSCETVKDQGAEETKKDDTIPPTPTRKTKIKTKGFLVTKDLALKSWLNKRFSINYVETTPQMVFVGDPLNGIKFKTSNLPTDAAPLSFQSSGLSRRELLKKVATFWKLDIVIVNNPEGVPVAITVTGKSSEE